MMLSHRARLVRLTAVIALGLATAGGCATKKTLLPAGTAEPDKYLFDKGQEALTKKKWLAAREYFRQIVDGYPQSQYRAEAKLGVGDSFLNEGSSASNVQAQSEFKEFLTFYPTHLRADYAQYRLAMCHFKQMPKAERDQTETREALKEFATFLDRFPNSELSSEVKARQREAQDRLSESDYKVGLFYFRSRWYPGAIDRFRSLLQTDPAYSSRDAVYFYLAEALVVVKREAEALPYYERLLAEFEKSEFLEPTQKRVAQLKASIASAAKPSGS